ncbi:MAG: sugar phosphate isomerase/epimerase family protein [Candidatus Poribacteria bacterium]|nr:sugar phosphate isomerase/epimerase family protein [Candidatus Poribacteria bacterium]
MKVGIRDGMLGLPLDQTFNKVSQIGFDGIEVCMGVDYRNHLIWQDGGVDQLKALSKGHNLEIPSLSPGGFTAFTFAHPQDSVRSEGIAMLQRLIEVAPELGSKVILVPFFGNAEIKREDLKSDRFIDGWKVVAGTAEKFDVQLGIESTIDATDHQFIIDQVDSTSIGVYYDMGNATTFGYDSVQEIHQLGNAIVQMHIKETGGNHPGEGDVDFPAVIEATRKINYDGWLVLETPAKEDAIVSAIRNMNFVRENYG